MVEVDDLKLNHWRELFLPVQPSGSTGLGRRLNPWAFYCAMRWSDYGISRAAARNALIKVTNTNKPTKSVYVRPVDFGPGDGNEVDGKTTQDTGRVIDLSTGAMLALQVETDNLVTVEWIEGAA